MVEHGKSPSPQPQSLFLASGGRKPPDGDSGGSRLQFACHALPPILLFAFALFQGLATNNQRDFFIYRLGAELAVRGENPYDVARIRQHVATQFPDDDAKEFVANCGYFLPPLAVLAFIPFAALPWSAATVAWALASGLAAFFLTRLPGLLRPAGSPPLTGLAWCVIPFVLVLNPLSIVIVLVGQLTLVCVGCVVAGLWCYERGRPWLAAILWAIPFVKPHIALPLIPLAWFLGGWRPAALLVVIVAGLNLAGAVIVGGSPLFLRQYLEYLPTAHKVVGYNRVELNPGITSWNRLLFAAGGPLVELTAVTTLAGYLVWFGLVTGRIAIANVRPSPTWVLAAGVIGAVLCAQVLGYELLLLVLVVPWVRDLFARGYRFHGWLAVVLLTVPLIPEGAMAQLGIVFPRSLGVALLAALLLVSPTGNAPGNASDKT